MVKEKVLISFDLSTTVIGICIQNYSTKEIIKLYYHNFINKIMIDKAMELQDLVENLFSGYINVECFVIEERLKAFAAGGTNAEAMGKTAALNFLCQYLVYKRGIKVKELNVNTARKLAYDGFHSAARKIKGGKQKEFAFKLVLNELGAEIFPTKVNKSGINKGKTVFLEEAKDMADAYILSKACFKILSGSL